MIAIPSKGRPDAVKSQVLVTSARVFVPEHEVEDYERCGTQHVVGVPAEVRGITATRNWILDNADDEWVVMVDDDIKLVGWTRLYRHTCKHSSFTEADFLRECVVAFDLCEDIGFRIWGPSTLNALCAIYPTNPFLWKTYVTASCIGIRNDGTLRFDERFPVKEDYELCLRCIVEDGGVLGVRYWYWVNEHWGTNGGCGAYRTQEMERNAIALLQEMYPGMVSWLPNKQNEFCIRLTLPEG